MTAKTGATRSLADVPPDTMVLLNLAHNFTDKSSSTIYRWVKNGTLTAVDSPEGLRVRLGDLYAARTRVRHGGARMKSNTRQGDTPE
jgi:hypothetical protein